MDAWTLFFVAVVLVGLAVQLWLGARQVAHVRAHAGRVPEPFADRITVAEHRKAAAYTLARLGVGRWELLLGTGLLLAWTLGGGLDHLDRGLAALGIDGLWQEWNAVKADERQDP